MIPCEAINQPYWSIAAIAIQCAESSSTRNFLTASANMPPPGTMNSGRSLSKKSRNQIRYPVVQASPSLNYNRGT